MPAGPVDQEGACFGKRPFAFVRVPRGLPFGTGLLPAPEGIFSDETRISTLICQ